MRTATQIVLFGNFNTSASRQHRDHILASCRMSLHYMKWLRCLRTFRVLKLPISTHKPETVLKLKLLILDGLQVHDTKSHTWRQSPASYRPNRELLMNYYDVDNVMAKSALEV